MNEITLFELWVEPSIDKFFLVVLFGINIVLTLVHCFRELKGYLWRYFSAIAGFRIPDKLGFFLFFVVLLVGLWTAGLFGIAAPLYGLPWPKLTMICVGIIIGGRISDSIYSHIRLHRKGYQPNPALRTVPYYLAEAAYLTVLFWPGIWKYSACAVSGFILGWLAFYTVLPIMRKLRKIITSWSRAQWQSGKSLPSWAQKYNEETLTSGN